MHQSIWCQTALHSNLHSGVFFLATEGTHIHTGSISLFWCVAIVHVWLTSDQQLHASSKAVFTDSPALV